VIVADVNLIAYLLLPGERTEEAEGVFRTDPEWVVPLLWRSELRTVLVGYVRTGDLTLGDAIRVVARAENLMAGREAEVDSRRVLELAVGSRCSAYDCEYVALAEYLGVRLVTADTKVLRNFPDVARSPRQFLEGAG